MRGGGHRRLAALLAVACLIATAICAGSPKEAAGERTQRGDLIVSLRGHISPLSLPRHDPAPVSLHLAGGLHSAGGGLLPRVERIEIGLPPQGIVSMAGLPVCSRRSLRNATSEGALEACRSALIGHGRVEADVLLPGQAPFRLHAHLLVFNGPVVRGHRRLLLHGFASRPPTSIVLPFTFERGKGRFGTTIGADLPPSLGPWPHLAKFELALGRRYFYRGRERSLLSAACPIPPLFTAGFFSLTRVAYTLLDGHSVSTAITRGCRAE